jgi:integrase
MENKQKRTPKGTVSVYAVDGRLKLRWMAKDTMNRPKRFVFTFGAENEINRMGADRLALDIGMDLVSGNFDPTLCKYKPRLERKLNPLTVARLIDRYVNAHIANDQSASIGALSSAEKPSIAAFQGDRD